ASIRRPASHAGSGAGALVDEPVAVFVAVVAGLGCARVDGVLALVTVTTHRGVSGRPWADDQRHRIVPPPVAIGIREAGDCALVDRAVAVVVDPVPTHLGEM